MAYTYIVVVLFTLPTTFHGRNGLEFGNGELICQCPIAVWAWACHRHRVCSYTSPGECRCLPGAKQVAEVIHHQVCVNGTQKVCIHTLSCSLQAYMSVCTCAHGSYRRDGMYRNAVWLQALAYVCIHFLHKESSKYTRILKFFIKNFLAKSHGVNSGPLCKGLRTSDPQSTEMSPLVSMLFRTLLNLLNFLMKIFNILVSLLFR